MKRIFILVFILSCHFAQAFTPKQNRLIAFAKLYSTVKFYYPEPKLVDFSWTALAYKGYKIANESESDEAFISEMKKIFAIIAPGVQITTGEFDQKMITPKSEKEFSTPAFWQHKGSLSPGSKSDIKQSSLNYIYKKNIKYYSLAQSFSPIAKHILDSKVKISFWAKLEGGMDSLKLVQLAPYNRKTKAFTYEYVSVKSGDWKFYEKEIDYPKEADYDKLLIVLPTSGTAYIDDLKFEKKEGDKWIPIILKNTNFEAWSKTGSLEGWEDPLSVGSVGIADEINKKEGKCGMKLNAITDKILYEPLAMNAPYQIDFPSGAKAFVPMQLKSNASEVFPLAKQSAIDELNEANKKLIADVNDNKVQAIASGIETYIQLLQDYGYRTAQFESNLTQSFINGIASIETNNPWNAWNYLYMDFLAWVNDPHLMVYSPRPEFSASKVRIPALTKIINGQVVVRKISTTKEKLNVGDVILKIGNIDLDSLLLSMTEREISVAIQDAYKFKLFNSFFEEKVTLKVKRGNEMKLVEFTKEENEKSARKDLSEFDEEEEIHERMMSEVKNKDIYYINASTQSIIDRKDKNKELNEAKMDSLVKVMNQYKKVIVDVRARPQNNFVEYFSTHLSNVDFSKQYDLEKIAFAPIGQFKYNNLNLLVQKSANITLKPKVVFLIDYSTRSATERLLVRLKNSKVATFVGSNTAGAAGAISQLKLDNNARMVYTAYMTKDFDYPNDAMSYQGKGIKPDVLISPTPNGVATEKDEVLEKAIEIK